MTTIVFVFRDDDDDRRYHFNDNKNKNCITSTPAAVYFFSSQCRFLQRNCEILVYEAILHVILVLYTNTTSTFIM